MRDLPPDPRLRGIAYRTKLAGEAEREYGAAGALDPHGVAVRVWVSTDPGDAPEDCRMEGESCTS